MPTDWARRHLLATSWPRARRGRSSPEPPGSDPADPIAVAPSMSAGPQVPTLTPSARRRARRIPSPRPHPRADETLLIVSIDAQAPYARAPSACQCCNVRSARLPAVRRRRSERTQRAPARISTLGAAQSADVVRGPRRLFALLAAVFTFGLACASVVVVAGIARGWRHAAELERAHDEVAAAGEEQRVRALDRASEPKPAQARARRA